MRRLLCCLLLLGVRLAGACTGRNERHLKTLWDVPPLLAARTPRVCSIEGISFGAYTVFQEACSRSTLRTTSKVRFGTLFDLARLTGLARYRNCSRRITDQRVACIGFGRFCGSRAGKCKRVAGRGSGLWVEGATSILAHQHGSRARCRVRKGSVAKRGQADSVG